MSTSRVHFDGGPLDGVTATGFMGWAIEFHSPPFICISLDAYYEHYVLVDDCETGETCYEYAGACDDIGLHPDCGHDHGGSPSGQQEEEAQA